MTVPALEIKVNQEELGGLEKWMGKNSGRRRSLTCELDEKVTTREACTGIRLDYLISRMDLLVSGFHKRSLKEASGVVVSRLAVSAEQRTIT